MSKLHTDYEARITADLAVVLIAGHTHNPYLGVLYGVFLIMDIYKGILQINDARRSCKKGCNKCQN